MEIDDALNYIIDVVNAKIEFERDNFIEFERKEKAKAYAVDGSSIKLFDASSFSIFARRVGYVFADEKGIIDKEIDDILIDICDENENEERREREENELAMKLKENNEIVMLDGCLNEKTDGIVAISKKSGLKIRNMPLIFLIKKFADKIMPSKCWYYEIEKGIYAAKLHPYSRFAFRIDYYGDDIEEILSSISAFCNDISCLGYPYPLAEVHKLVTIKQEEGEYLKYALFKKAIEKGAKMDDLEGMFYDYHEYLEG